jgi:hypothetical protein
VSEGLSLEDFEGDPIARDFRRANGAPMVRALDDPTKWDRYSRPSGWGETLDEQSALVNWKIDRAIEGVACDPALQAKIASHLGDKEGAKDRRELAIQRGRGEEAADVGTALHKMCERVERGENYRVPPPFDADVAAYLTCLGDAGLVSEHIEVKLCSDEWRAAGTADRIYRCDRDLYLPSGELIPAGSLILGDLKTGKRKDYSIPGYVIQLALYVDSVFYDVETHVREPLPESLRTDWGLIVRMPAGSASCELLWADLQVGREGAQIVRHVRAWRKRSDFVAPFTPAPADTEAVLSEVLLSLEPDVEESGADEWLELMMPFAQERINRIGIVSNECRDLLLRRWPANVAPLRAGTPSPAQMTQILDLLDAVEAAFSLPFLPDPRSSMSAGLHTSEIVRTNNPNNGAMQP